MTWRLALPRDVWLLFSPQGMATAKRSIQRLPEAGQSQR